LSTKFLAHLALFSVAVFYSANYLIAKGLRPNVIGPSGFIFLRVTGAGLLFWLLFAFNKEKVSISDFPRLILCGITGVAVNQLFFFNGLSATSPVNASIMLTSNPILVLIASAVILRTRISKRKIVGILLGAAGAVSLLLLSRGNTTAHATWQGDLMVFFNAMSYGFYLVLVKPLMGKYKPITVISWVFLFGWLIVTPIGLSQAMAVDWAALTGSHWLAIAYVIIATTFLAYLLNIWAMKTVAPTVVSVYIYLQPLLAGLFAFVFAYFGGADYTGDINWQRILCAALIFTGVYLVSSEPGRKQALAK
jgi:drug/metabolite transporter (DMT)-like permease